LGNIALHLAINPNDIFTVATLDETIDDGGLVAHGYDYVIINDDLAAQAGAINALALLAAKKQGAGKRLGYVGDFAG